MITWALGLAFFASKSNVRGLRNVYDLYCPQASLTYKNKWLSDSGIGASTPGGGGAYIPQNLNIKTIDSVITPVIHYDHSDERSGYNARRKSSEVHITERGGGL